MSTFDLETPAPEWEEWSPNAIPHVKGRYEKRRFNEHKLPLPQHWEALCEKCGQKYGGPCMTGAVRTHIAAFATKHIHADPLDVPRVERPSSLRRRRMNGDYE